ncbi:bifunctional folylpolyglutamate synthase/dihydrofolate synthase [Alkalihalobacillus deserti]|uniref:bifunctional folylpolyglutamate synthase/dihydrofolate synthase n=1 Tax=Alkalihalobacillus deserti TaxID=2879466 RepID=UPI001D13C3DD|nr:folylpolyglutamate synthase/dihydrofolate synthase family protein [Alkalihalobacillus deserti]
MKNGAEVIEWIQGLLPFGIKPGLERMEWMLQRLEHPEKKLKTIHIAGTNGKGSTVSFLKHVLIEAGYNVGTFTSPSLEWFEDRICINGTPIPENALISCAARIQPLVEELWESDIGSPTEFEVITTIALDYFAHIAKPDIVLIEVGLGGRLDSTNVITPMLSVITSIGFDHMHILGTSLAEIATEKAGIIKPNIPIISGVSQNEAQAAITHIAKQKEAPLYQLRQAFKETLVTKSEEKQVFTYEQIGHEAFDVTIQMPGPHQRENAAVAICTLEVLKNVNTFKVETEHIEKGLHATTWPGRFERIQKEPLVILDGAHNKEGMEALARTLQQHYPMKRYRFLVAATKEKDMNILLQPFIKQDATFTFTSFDFERAAIAVDLWTQALVVRKRYNEDWEQALNEELQAIKKDEVLIICGSLYFISKVREYWKSLIRT